MTVKAIYENGVFRPTEPFSLPEMTPVELTVRQTGNEADADIFEILSRRYPTGQSDAAERHDEHQE